MKLFRSNLGLSMRAHLFQNVFELFHAKTSLRELNKNRDSYVTANLSNNERRGTIKSSMAH